MASPGGLPNFLTFVVLFHFVSHLCVFLRSIAVLFPLSSILQQSAAPSFVDPSISTLVVLFSKLYCIVHLLVALYNITPQTCLVLTMLQPVIALRDNARVHNATEYATLRTTLDFPDLNPSGQIKHIWGRYGADMGRFWGRYAPDRECSRYG